MFVSIYWVTLNTISGKTWYAKEEVYDIDAL